MHILNPNRTPHSTPCRDSCKTPFLNLIRGGQSFQSPLMKEYALNPTRDPTIARVLSSTLLPFLFWGLLINQNSKNKGTLIIKGLLRNLDNKGVFLTKGISEGLDTCSHAVPPFGGQSISGM